MSKYTPGPWHVEEDFIDGEKSFDYLRVVGDGALVAGRILIDDDARLIAAAPELLAALQEAVDGMGGSYAIWSKTAIAAIAKAKGD